MILVSTVIFVILFFVLIFSGYLQDPLSAVFYINALALIFERKLQGGKVKFLKALYIAVVIAVLTFDYDSRGLVYQHLLLITTIISVFRLQVERACGFSVFNQIIREAVAYLFIVAMFELDELNMGILVLYVSFLAILYEHSPYDLHGGVYLRGYGLAILVITASSLIPGCGLDWIVLLGFSFVCVIRGLTRDL